MDFFHLGPMFGSAIMWIFGLVNNYVLAIVIFTLLIKLFMAPFAIKSQKSQAQNARFASKQKQIKEKYKNDKKKLNEELMKLQSEQSGLGLGCLAMIVPLLVLFALYPVMYSPLDKMMHIEKSKIQSAAEVVKKIENSGNGNEELKIIKLYPENKEKFSMFSEDESFKIEKMSKSSRIFNSSLFEAPNENLFKNFLWVFWVVNLLTSLALQYIVLKFSSTQMQTGASKYTGYIMFLVFSFFMFSFPAALLIYYSASNIIEIIQKLILEKFYNVYIVNAKSETARALRKISEEKQVKKLSKRV